MRTITQSNTFPVLVLIAALTFSLALFSYVSSAWQAPSQTPPDGNVAAPVNTSSNIQTFQDSKTLKVKSDASGAIDLFGGLGISGVLDVESQITDSASGKVIYDGDFIDPSVLPFKKGDLIAPGDRPLLTGLTDYLTDYFNISELGIDAVTGEAANVKQGVNFGPGGALVGTAAVTAGYTTTFGSAGVPSGNVHSTGGSLQQNIPFCSVGYLTPINTSIVVNSNNSIVVMTWMGFISNDGSGDSVTNFETDIPLIFDGVTVANGSYSASDDDGSTEIPATVDGVSAVVTGVAAGTHSVQVDICGENEDLSVHQLMYYILSPI